ncbi:MAG: hypothetical protein ACE5EF_00100 [Dehalococcoidia bacterium]
MPDLDAASGAEEPGAGPQDSARDNAGVRPGGITPQVEQALSQLPPGNRAIVEQDIAQRNRYLTAERQRLASDVKLAGVLRDLLKDRQFQGYMQAREKGDVTMFFRDELGIDGDAGGAGGGDNLTEPGSEARPDSADGSPPQDDTVRALQQQIHALEAKLGGWENQQRQAVVVSELEEFQHAHPDYEDFLPAMTKIKQERYSSVEMPLEDLYLLARREVEQGLASLAPAAGAEPRQAPGTNQSPPATASQGTPPGKGGGRSRTLEEAWREAKRAHGIDGEVTLTFASDSA